MSQFGNQLNPKMKKPIDILFRIARRHLLSRISRRLMFLSR